MSCKKFLQSSLKFGRLIGCLAVAVAVIYRGSIYFNEPSTPTLDLVPVFMCAATSFFVVLLGIAWTFEDPSEESYM